MRKNKFVFIVPLVFFLFLFFIPAALAAPGETFPMTCKCDSSTTQTCATVCQNVTPKTMELCVCSESGESKKKEVGKTCEKQCEITADMLSFPNECDCSKSMTEDCAELCTFFQLKTGVLCFCDTITGPIQTPAGNTCVNYCADKSIKDAGVDVGTKGAGTTGAAPAPVQPSSADMINDALGKIDQLTPAEMNKSDDLASIVGKAISLILGIIGSAALLVFLYSGIMWMTSGGADKTIANAQKSMIWAAIGLFTVFFSYILVKYIITQAGA